MKGNDNHALTTIIIITIFNPFKQYRNGSVRKATCFGMEGQSSNPGSVGFFPAVRPDYDPMSSTTGSGQKPSKALPVTGRGDVEDSQMLRIPHRLYNRLIDGG
jgi:hypothetical protein